MAQVDQKDWSYFQQRTRRKTVLMTLLYGGNWARVLEALLNRVYNELKIELPMLVVSVGDEA